LTTHLKPTTPPPTTAPRRTRSSSPQARASSPRPHCPSGSHKTGSTRNPTSASSGSSYPNASFRTRSNNAETALERRIVAVLIDALVNIQREIGFFEDVAREYGLDLAVVPEGEETFGPGTITQAYIDLFMSAGSP
ncbi:hypothetical protein ANOM_011898, partial [Aspergillus nomiae NRRL 13137]